MVIIVTQNILAQGSKTNAVYSLLNLMSPLMYHDLVVQVTIKQDVRNCSMPIHKNWCHYHTKSEENKAVPMRLGICTFKAVPIFPWTFSSGRHPFRSTQASFWCCNNQILAGHFGLLYWHKWLTHQEGVLHLWPRMEESLLPCRASMAKYR